MSWWNSLRPPRSGLLCGEVWPCSSTGRSSAENGIKANYCQCFLWSDACIALYNVTNLAKTHLDSIPRTMYHSSGLISPCLEFAKHGSHCFLMIWLDYCIYWASIYLFKATLTKIHVDTNELYYCLNKKLKNTFSCAKKEKNVVKFSDRREHFWTEIVSNCSQ